MARSRKTVELYRAMYEAKFCFFARLVFESALPHTELVESFHIDVVCKALVDLLRSGQHQGLVINLPPRTLKSVISSVAFPLYALIHRPAARIMVLAGTQDLASELLKNLALVLNSEKFRSLFGDLTYARVRSELRFPQGGSIQVSVFGHDIIGKGFDICIIDDPQSPAASTDASLRLAAISYFGSSVLPRMNDLKAGRIVVVQQRLHESDLSGYLSQREGWTALAIPAVSTGAETFHTELNTVRREQRQPICEQRETLADLRQRLASMGGNDFMAQYQQRPSPDERPAEYRGQIVYVRTGIGPDGPKYAHAPTLIRESATVRANAEFFGRPLQYMRYDPRPLTLEEWEAETIAHQAALVAPARRQEPRPESIS